MERTVYVDGTQEQIEVAKQLLNEILSEVCNKFYFFCSFPWRF
jgi:hypothetical protein